MWELPSGCVIKLDVWHIFGCKWGLIQLISADQDKPGQIKTGTSGIVHVQM